MKQAKIELEEEQRNEYYDLWNKYIRRLLSKFK